MSSVRHVVPVVAALGVVAVAIGVRTGDHPASRRPPKRGAPAVAALEAGRELILRAYASLPLTFVENRGQTDPRVRYYTQGTHCTFYLTHEEVVLSFVNGSHAPEPRVVPAVFTAAATEKPATHGVVLALRFLGANRRTVLEGEDRAPGQVNYFRGNDPARWRTELPRYAQVVYRELWPGVDLRLREQAGRLKYEFRVRPAARLTDIRLAYTGATGLKLDGAGGLLIDTALGVLRDSPPVAYQQIAGVRVPVESRYVLGATDEYSFAIGASYRPDRELIIDPGLDYSTFLGGASHESGARIAVDSAGNAYVVGLTQSPDFPTTAGAFDRTGAASNFLDAFVAKLNPTGTALVYSTFLGGSNFEWGRAIAIDAAGNAYIAGQTKSADFPTTPGAFDRTFNIPNCPRCGIDQYDAFVTKLDATGSRLVYSTFLGGTDLDDALGIAVDAAGNAYITGETGSPDFPTTIGAFHTTGSGAFDAFVTKLNASGSALVYSTLIGGTNVDYGVRIAVDASNNAYVVGNTSSPDFPTTPGAFDTSQNGQFDAFVLKLNAAGSSLVYSTFLGGLNMDGAGGLAIDAAGNAYVTGGTSSADFPTTPGAFKTVSDGSDGFVTKLNPAGSALVYSTLLGGTGSDDVSGIALDASGNAFLTGGTSSPDFPTTPGAVSTVFNGGGGDAYVAELNANGSALLYATFLGGTNSEGGSDVALGPGGSVYITGQTLSADFPTTPGAFDRVWNGDLTIFWADAFVARLTPGSAPSVPASLSALTVSPSGVVGGNTASGTVSLTSGAPSGGAVVSLASSNTAVATVPASVTVAAGATSATFTVSTVSVTVSTSATISGVFGGASRSAVLTISPPPAAASLSSLAVSPTSVTGGGASQGTVTLTSAAPAGGAVVSLSSSSAAATVAGSVTVAQGATSGTFPITTSSVTTSTMVTISASFGGVTKTAALTVTPPAATATLTVTATGRSGESVTSSPAGINVAVGSTMSAPFATGTVIGLSVSNGRDAIWSGGCSSGGAKWKSCSLTLNAAASVTANVQ